MPTRLPRDLRAISSRQPFILLFGPAQITHRICHFSESLRIRDERLALLFWYIGNLGWIDETVPLR